MIYYIGYLPPKKFQDFYTSLVKDISKRFELNKLTQKNRIPHITLKSPFEVSSLQSLDKLIASFCQPQKSSRISIGGVGSFGEEIIFLYSHPSKQEIFRELLDNLRNLEEINWGEYDNPNKTLHITIAKGEELNGKFQEVYNYLCRKNIQLVLPFDNITIFQKDDQTTSVYRTHYLGKHH